MIATAEEADLGEKTFHQLAFEAVYLGTGAEPYLLVRAPLDEGLSESLEHTFALGVRIRL